jgi:formylglycine-generating enzyme required for sulfatase activity
LTGYRLPTEAEMEFACRAEAGTKWCCGQAQELLRKYGWYASNSEDRSWPAGSLRPNDFGLFDVHGNVCNWCQYRYAAYPRAPEGGVAADDDSENTLGNNDLPKKFDFRVLRGGSFAYFYARSAERRNEQAVTRNNDFGFRPARTFTP